MPRKRKYRSARQEAAVRGVTPGTSKESDMVIELPEYATSSKGGPFSSRERSARYRASQTPYERAKRLAKARERHAIMRVFETEEKREVRLAKDRQRHALMRERETKEMRQIRLLKDRERHVLMRERETEEERRYRLRLDRERHARLRARGTEDIWEDTLVESWEDNAIWAPVGDG